MKYLLKDITVINEGSRIETDLLIKDERIERIDSHISGDGNTKIIDGGNKILVPGFIDDQVHFREPGLTHKADIASESKAAVAGGTTTVFDMPTTTPPAVTREAILNKISNAIGKTHANYSAYLGATNDNIVEIMSLKPSDVPGIKVFMGSSTGNMLVDKKESLEQIFAQAPVPIVTHCEDTPMIAKQESIYREKFGDQIDPEMHADIRSREACYKSSSYAVELAKKYGTRLHVLHLTTKEEIDLFERGDVQEKQITGEVCIHHLWYSKKDYKDLGNLIKCNPSVKEETDRMALIQALKNNVLNVIATDHAPHLLSEKNNNYFEAPSGLPLIQHAFQMLLELCHQGYFTLEEAVALSSHNPANLFNIKDRGFIREGFYADLVIVNPNETHKVDESELFYKCKWSPLKDFEFHQTIDTTFVNGKMVFNHGRILEEPKGQRILFER